MFDRLIDIGHHLSAFLDDLKKQAGSTDLPAEKNKLYEDGLYLTVR